MEDDIFEDNVSEHLKYKASAEIIAAMDELTPRQRNIVFTAIQQIIDNNVHTGTIEGILDIIAWARTQ